jgi:glutamate-1-semialdehyde 2,1-aminomutase
VADSELGQGVPSGGTSRMFGTNEEWFARARRVIPGGVDSPVRSFASVGGVPFTAQRGEGPWVFDVEGRRYLDLVQSYGALLLGHAHPAVTSAVAAAAASGTTFGFPTPGEVLLAEAICRRVAGCEQVRFVSSGTEAAMSAVRLARGATGRNRVVRFAGCYHGHSDGLLAGGGSGVATLGLPGSAGVPPGAVADTLVAPYNQPVRLDGEVACVLVEPVAANMNLVAPAPGFLESLRRACDAHGALLIFDEVITGFRLGEGGASGWSGVTPDLWCFGKVVGGGLPIGAVGGRADLLAHLAPDGPVYQAGTLSGNPLATAAGLAVLSAVSPEDYRALSDRAAAFATQLAKAVTEGGLRAAVPSVGPLLGLFVAYAGSDPASSGGTSGADPDDGGPLRPPTDYEGSQRIAASGAYAPFFHALLRRGVMVAPGPYEVLFPGMAHGERELALAAEAAGEAAAEVASSVLDN